MSVLVAIERGRKFSILVAMDGHSFVIYYAATCRADCTAWVLVRRYVLG